MVEAKPIQNASIGLPQLLVYMVGVQRARQEKTNQVVFGMSSDGENFSFTFLDQNKKFYVSRSLEWRCDRRTILTYIDTMLLDAIHSSPHTTSTKSGNTTLLQYPRYLRGQWNFGGLEEREDEEEEVEDEMNFDDVVDIVKTERGLVLRSVKKSGGVVVDRAQS